MKEISSYSDNPVNVVVDYFRYIRHDKNFRILWTIIVIVGVTIASVCLLLALGYASNSILFWLAIAILIILLLVGIASLAMVKISYRILKDKYESADLTPAIIINISPIRLMCFADVSIDIDDSIPVVKISEIGSLPFHKIQVGEVVPCASDYLQGTEDDRWSDFRPTPIAWATGDDLIIRASINRLKKEEVELLRKIIKSGNTQFATGKIVKIKNA